MPPRLLLVLSRGGFFVPRHPRRSPALSPLPRSIPSTKRPGTFVSPSIRAFSGYSGMAAGSPEQQPQQRSLVVRETVELTEKEELIFRRLLDVVRHFGLGTQLRVAGGWVRDKVSFTFLVFPLLQKEAFLDVSLMILDLGGNILGFELVMLLGKDSADIDIALDNMTGQHFCEKVNEYSGLVGEKQKGICVIQCNPDQSKHLETARMLIFDIWIDFVNLRSEKYAENSRIPTMEVGTAEEDAYRRDLTINSLFFTINDNLVEDLTGRGIEDLKKGLIVTPLPAKDTFLDDPLRVLRAIRFAARFNFTLAEDLKEATSDERVKSELGSKISKERIGHEFDLMMSDKHPVKAMRDIRDLGLFYVVFSFPENPDPPVFDKCDWQCVSHIEAAWNLANSIGSSLFSSAKLQFHLCTMASRDYLNIICSLLTSLNTMVFRMSSEGFSCIVHYSFPYEIWSTWTKDLRSLLHHWQVPVSSYIIKQSLKLKTSDAETVANIHAASVKFAEFVLLLEHNVDVATLKENLEDEYLEIPTGSVKRVLAGLVLRDIKEFWRVALFISILSYPEAENAANILNKQDELQQRKEKYIKVERAITDLGLDEVWKLKPVLDGKSIMGVMQVMSGGPLIGKWQQRALKWQLAHPNGTVDECIEWIKQSQLKRQKVEIST
ncbi:hypothetical protein HU200_059620 [Digitaria exilis]|uniref:Poly A polymerase n=1 Tax=Digitaria exilis TaxID=1010633 RepID=A0A835A846_9POAL|nr:hypothetical protein HU200_059620 [Digitaria exilis]